VLTKEPGGAVNAPASSRGYVIGGAEMRIHTAVFATACLSCFGVRAMAGAPDLAREIRATSDAVFRATGAEGDVKTPLLQLVDLAGRIAADAGLETARSRIAAASATGRRLSPLDERSRAAVAGAYAAVNGGRSFEFPRSVESIEQAKEHGRGQVDRCLAALGAGRHEEAARELLGFVLLVITPMEKKG
jgi:hypothetical protein